MSTIADINAEARSLVDADSTSYTDPVLLRRVNQAYEEIVSAIIRSDGTWQFDDSNFSTNPVGRATLTSGQNEYTFTNSFLDIEEVDILSKNSYYIKLDPIDSSELGMSFEEYFGITFDGSNYVAKSGMPTHYDKLGNTIKFNLAPTAAYCTLANGLRVRFKRNADFYTSPDVTAGTKEPGFAINHLVLAYKAALPYAASYKKDRVAWLNNEINRMTNEIIAHYGSREKDVRKIMTMKPISFR